MPKQRRYLSGFNLHKGLQLSGYQLENISVGHVTIVRYREYQYPSVLTWKKIQDGADPNQLLNSVSSYLRGEKTIYTAYGNPYKCDFGSLVLDRHDDIHAYIVGTGQCDRI